MSWFNKKIPMNFCDCLRHEVSEALKAHAEYEKLLEDSFIMKEMSTFQNSLHILENERLFTKYPQAISNLFEKVMAVGEEPKQGLYRTILQELKNNFINIETFKDLLQFRKI